MIEKISQLSYIQLKDEEKIGLKKDFEDIRKFIEVLKEVTIKGILPTIHPFMKNLRTKEDKIEKSILSEEIINNAPELSEKHFKIEKILN